MSPIRPENKARYPEDWDQVSRSVKDRAGWQCECRGECGEVHPLPCGRGHGTTYARIDGTHYKIILTVAHLNHPPEDCRPENLRVMCQGCHLRYDADHHAQTRAAGERARAEAAGQGLLEMDVTP